MTAALVRRLLAGLPLESDEGPFRSLPYLIAPGREGIFDMRGRGFADNRLMTLFIIPLPAGTG